MKFTKSLQVPGNFPLDNRKYRHPVKRVLGSASAEMEAGDVREASLTVEAAVCLPLFLMLTWALLQPVFWLDRQRQAQTVTERFCEELSQYGYLEALAAEGMEPPSGEEMAEMEEDGGTGEKNGFPDWLPGLKNSVLGMWLRGRLEPVLEHAADLRIREIQVPDSDGNIRIETEYRERIPFFPAAEDGVVMRTAAVRRVWTGIRGKLESAVQERQESDGTLVFTGAGMGRYHLYRDCHYLSNAYQAVRAEDVDSLRNAFGERYKPCSRCCGEKGGDMVYITPGGEHYHSSMSCSAMNAYIREVLLEEAEHLGCCSYCSRRRESER